MNTYGQSAPFCLSLFPLRPSPPLLTRPRHLHTPNRAPLFLSALSLPLYTRCLKTFALSPDRRWQEGNWAERGGGGGGSGDDGGDNSGGGGGGNGVGSFESVGAPPSRGIVSQV